MTEWSGGCFAAADFRLDKGGVLPVAELAYVHAGQLAPDGRNAVLMTHGYTSTHRYVEPGSAAAEGSWSELVGPGRAIDTDRFFVISSNALGSCYGSSGPASVDPVSGRRYGADFPRVTLADSVRLQWGLVQFLGVKRLHAVAGPSMGGFQALEWGVQFPDDVDRLVVAVSGLQGPSGGAAAIDALTSQIRADTGWNDGQPTPGAMTPLLTRLRLDTLRHYGMAERLHDDGLAPAQVARRMTELARSWAEGFDAWSLVSLREAINDYDVSNRLDRIRAKVLLALGSTDLLFPGSQGPAVKQRLRAAGVDARFHQIDSRYGHLASGMDWQQWEPALRAFMA